MCVRILRGVAALLTAGALLLPGRVVSAQTAGRVVTIFNRVLVPTATRITTTTAGIDVDGYKYANVFVE